VAGPDQDVLDRSAYTLFTLSRFRKMLAQFNRGTVGEDERFANFPGNQIVGLFCWRRSVSQDVRPRPSQKVSGQALGIEVGPDYKRPEVKPVEDFRSQIGPSEATSLADLGWWQVFNDKALQGLIVTALEHNYDSNSPQIVSSSHVHWLASRRPSYIRR